MSLFDLELQPAHQIAPRGQTLIEDELDLFGISDLDLKGYKGIVENTDFDNEIEFFRMDTFKKESLSPKIKEKPVNRLNDHRPDTVPIDDFIQR